MAKFTFLGFLKKDTRKLIFLAKDKEIYIVQQGDRSASDYEVTSITNDTLIMRSSTGGGELSSHLPKIRRCRVRLKNECTFNEQMFF